MDATDFEKLQARTVMRLKIVLIGGERPLFWQCPACMFIVVARNKKSKGWAIYDHRTHRPSCRSAMWSRLHPGTKEPSRW